MLLWCVLVGRKKVSEEGALKKIFNNRWTARLGLARAASPGKLFRLNLAGPLRRLMTLCRILGLPRLVPLACTCIRGGQRRTVT